MLNEQFYRQQYDSLSSIEQHIINVLAFYLHPVENYLVIDGVKSLTSLEAPEITAHIKSLLAKGLIIKEITGTYSLPLVLNFMIFPQVITNPAYHFLNQLTRGVNPIFFQLNIRLQELQQLLTAYFTGSRSLLLLPVKKLEQELLQYLPHVSYLLYFPAYTDLLKFFSQESMDTLVAYALNQQLLQLQPLNELDTFAKTQEYNFPILHLLQGQLKPGNKELYYYEAVEQLYNGKPQEAFSLFEKGLKLQRKQDKKHSLPNTAIWAFYYTFLLTQLLGKHITALTEKLVTAYDRKALPEFVPAIALLHLQAGRREKAENQLQLILERNDQLLTSFLAILGLRLLYRGSRLLRRNDLLAGKLLSIAVKSGYNLLVYEYIGLYQDENYRGYESLFLQQQTAIGARPLFAQSTPTPEWERLINILLETEKPAKDKEQAESRLIYLVDFDHYKIQPVLQTNQADGWSNGRNIALKRLKESRLPEMTEQDHRIANTVQKEHYYNHDGEHYTFGEDVWKTIAGHQLLFATDAVTNIEIVIGKPELSINTTAHGYTFSANINDFSSNTVFVRESATRLVVIQLTAQQRKVLQTLDQIPYVPEAGKEKMVALIKTLGSQLTIHAEVGELNTDLLKLNADSRIVVQIVPLGQGLKASFYVKPFNSEPPYCKPGSGAIYVIGLSKGVRAQAIRDLEKERQHFNSFLGLVQGLISTEFTEDAIIFEDPLDCLELVEIIQQYPDIVRAEWPEGQRYKVSPQVSFMELRLSIQEKHHWFQCEGELKVDEDTVLSLQSLLDTSRTVKKRFVELEGGVYLSLAGDLRKRLNELASVTYFDNNTINIQPFALPLLDELIEKAGSVSTDKRFDQVTKRRVAAMTAQPVVPATLQTTLRPYQEEGFQWMTRLAAWGAGACLADDMGLGKTIQAIALLLHRAADGAALVICPASVMMNWTHELSRFAPTLNVQTLQQGDRENTIKNAGPFTVLLTTYGLMQSSDQLSSVQWHTIIFDEAHTIKNFQTKTARAALQLQGTFRLMLTGTPIQNHMLELWSLFNFLNPGLLGSLEHFNKQFVFPAVRNPADEIKQHLRKLVAPFLLRRTKTAVLDELPSKTEITKLVTLSPSEKAFYEALRRTALERIQHQDNKQGQQHIRALAEITRLRMAACNPRLADPESDILSSKLGVFIEIAKELIDNNHRALVFSQFVQHLSLVREALDREGIDYLYLDGSTSMKQREQRVKDFQSGKGSLFLISLKAGGQGLNLTAADYVIQLDPWWNPAIEDQAADRAYRIGQTRPVTVYRLVAAQTIEEKIIQLHHLKRELADQLLSGTEMAGTLSTDDLLDLLSVG